MKRGAIYAILIIICICFFFSTARTNSQIGKKFTCGDATFIEKETPSSGDLEISIVYTVLMKI